MSNVRAYEKISPCVYRSGFVRHCAAVSYYLHHGSADEKLKTFYYRGIVSFYSNDYDTAMEWFVKGNQFSDEAEDIRQSALLCFNRHDSRAIIEKDREYAPPRSH